MTTQTTMATTNISNHSTNSANQALVDDNRHTPSPNDGHIVQQHLVYNDSEEEYDEHHPDLAYSAIESDFVVPMYHHHHASNAYKQSQQSFIPQVQYSDQIKQICDETGYAIFQENGQRKFSSLQYGKDFKLDKGCEVFIGKIPRDCFEDELIPIFNRIGKIFELRLMMDFSGTTRGFGFVSYFSSDDAQRAVSELNNYELRPGKKIGVCLSIDNCRLFIGGIPKSKTKSEIFEEMSKITENVVDVIVYPSVTDKMKNRGFAFVEYETHRDAAMARRRLIPGKISLWGNAVAVDWAEPELEVPKDIMQNVKILYVRNLMLSTSEEFIRDSFAEAAECSLNEIERVKKIKDFAFIHFSSRNSALKAMRALNDTKIDGSVVEVTLAKPVDKNSHFYNKINRMNNYNKLPPSMRFFNQLIHQQGMIPHGMGAPPHQMSPYYYPNSFKHMPGQIHHHHPVAPPLNHYIDPMNYHAMAPNLVSIPDSPNSPKNHHQLSCVQLLEDICIANQWGTPSFDMSICSSETGVLYTFQVKIPNLPNFFPEDLLISIGCDKNGVFSPKDFIAGLDDSKEMCAGRVISSLDALIQNDMLTANNGSQFKSSSHMFHPTKSVDLSALDEKFAHSSVTTASSQLTNATALNSTALYDALPNINATNNNPISHQNEQEFDIGTASDPTTNMVNYNTASNSLCSNSVDSSNAPQNEEL